MRHRLGGRRLHKDAKIELRLKKASVAYQWRLNIQLLESLKQKFMAYVYELYIELKNPHLPFIFHSHTGCKNL